MNRLVRHSLLINIVALCLSFGTMVNSVIKTAYAIAPEEQLSDPLLEERARGLSAQLRCLVCQNQSIDDSDADLAVDLRREVREQLVAGLEDKRILANLQATYGDYILLNPPVNPATYLLWAAPVFLLGAALLLFYLYRRGMMQDVSEKPLDNMAGKGSDNVGPLADKAPLSPKALGSVVVLIISVTSLLYWQLGKPEIAAQPLSQRLEERQEAQAVEAKQDAALQEALNVAKARADQSPSNVESQLVLALAYARVDDFQNEIIALRRALTLANDAPPIKAMLAEALSRQADGQVTLPARALIAEVLSINPNEPRALFMAGLAAYQDELFGEAITAWMQLANSAPVQSPWPALARRNIQLAAEEGGIALDDEWQESLDEDTVSAIASASEDEQREMIVAMVEGLETRLQDAPDDAQGWQRLIQARRVLEDEAGLLRALIGAARNLPDDTSVQLALLEHGLSGEPTQQWQDAAEQALGNLARLDNQALEYLFFAGHLARLKGNANQALNHFEALATRIEGIDAGFYDELMALIAELKTQ